MPESFQTPSKLDYKIEKETQLIRESMSRVDELTDIKFVPGLEESVGYFPLLESIPGKPIRARFSYGLNSPNMSAAHFDSQKGESQVTGERNTKLFIESQKIDSRYVVQALGKFEGNEPQIEEVSIDTLKDKAKSVGNVVFTRDPRLTLIIKPADCPTGILYANDRDGNPIAGILHGGAAALNVGLTRQGLLAMESELGVDLSRAKLGIFPGMKDYTLSRSWRDTDGEIKRRYEGLYPLNLGEYLAPATTDDPLEKRVVDLTSVFEMQALQAGMDPLNIQAYRVDTYADAKKGRAYSRRFSNDNKGAHPGGQVIVVALTPSIAA